MSWKLSNRIRDVEEIKRLMKEAKSFDGYAVVEGKKDILGLKKFGFNTIIPLSGKPLSAIPEILKHKEKVVILTDFDKEGQKKAAQLTKLLQSYGIFVDEPFRKRIKKILKINKIEEIVNLEI